MGDDKTSQVPKNYQELSPSVKQEPASENHSSLTVSTPLKNVSSRGPTKEGLSSFSSLLPCKTPQPEMSTADTPDPQALETQFTWLSNEVTSEKSPTANSGQGRTQTEVLSIKPRTRSTTARAREKANPSGSSMQEPTPAAQNSRYPIRHKTRQTALTNHSPTVGSNSNSPPQNPTPTRRRQKQIVRAQRANGEGCELPGADDTGPGNDEKEGEKPIKAPNSGKNVEGPEKFLFTMKGPHEPGLKHLAAAIDPLPQAKGLHNQPTCPVVEDEANLSDRAIKLERRKFPESDITIQLGRLPDENISSAIALPSLPSTQNAADHITPRGEESNADVSGRSNEGHAANLSSVEPSSSPQPVQAHYTSGHPEMSTPEQLLLNISQNPSPAMTDLHRRAIPVYQGQWYNYYTEVQYTVYIWASGPWPPNPTTRWNRFTVTSSSPVTLLFEYIGRSRPDTGLIEVGGGLISHFLGDVRRYGTRMDQTGWPTTLCLRPCERLPLGFSHWGDFMRSSGMRIY